MSRSRSSRWSLAAGIVAVAAVRVLGQDARSLASTGPTPIASLPFELNSNKVYLDVGVNGASHTFILDTGAPSTFLDEQLVGSLGLELEGGGASGGLGQNTVMQHEVHDVALTLGTLALAPQDMGVLPLDRVLRGYEGHAVSGLVGNDITSRYVVEIDYQARMLRWYAPESFEYDGTGHIVPVDMAGHAFVRARVQPFGREAIEATLLVDIGVRNALMLYAPFVMRHELMPPPTLAMQATVGWGIGGEVLSYVGRLAACEVGGFTLPQPVATFATDTSGLQASEEYDGILGAEVLRRFRLFLDLGHRRIILEPNASFDEAFEFDMSGLVLTAEGDDLRSFRVHRVLERSPAAEAGVRAGDGILAVDERPARELTLETLRGLMLEPGARRMLEVQRDGETLRIGLTLRPLVKSAV
jgi:hypothetical protein